MNTPSIETAGARSKAVAERGRLRTVAYYPEFDSRESLSNHYHRACWYLPAVSGALDQVVMGVAETFPIDPRPSHMCAPRQPVSHVRVEPNRSRYLEALSAADLILCWRGYSSAQTELSPLGIRILNVDTNDVESVEYGNYCKASWIMVPVADRKPIIAAKHRIFLGIAEDVRQSAPRSAAVFGTGPSIDRALDFDWNGVLSIVCNSVVQSDALLACIKPRFICAGDVVSHHGVSAYAARFRADLVRVLEKFDCYFLTTAPFGWLFQQQHPEIADRVLLGEQLVKEPVYDLAQEWVLPQLDSTLNIHMLPLASTFCRRIYLLGCDGKNPDPSKNEDFWPHSTIAQYHDLVGSGHLCHPTFDVRRQRSTHGGYLQSVERTFQIGESKHGKSYFTLAPSYTPGISTRLVPGDAVTRTTAGKLAVV